MSGDFWVRLFCILMCMMYAYVIGRWHGRRAAHRELGVRIKAEIAAATARQLPNLPNQNHRGMSN